MPCVRAGMYEVKTEKLFVVLCTSFLYKTHRWQRVTFYDPWPIWPISERTRERPTWPMSHDPWLTSYEYCLSSAHLWLWHQHRVGYKILILVFQLPLCRDFRRKSIKKCVRESADRQRDRQTDTCRNRDKLINLYKFIICPMLYAIARPMGQILPSRTVI